MTGKYLFDTHVQTDRQTDRRTQSEIKSEIFFNKKKSLAKSHCDQAKEVKLEVSSSEAISLMTESLTEWK